MRADFDRNTAAVRHHAGIFLQIDERNPITLAQSIKPAAFHRILRFIAHPGPFHDFHMVKTLLKQILHQPGNDLRMGGGTLLRRNRAQQIRLDRNFRLLRRDHLFKTGPFGGAKCHLFIITPDAYVNFIFLHG